MYLHVQLMIQLMDRGAITFDYGNNIRARAEEHEKKIENRKSKIESEDNSQLNDLPVFPVE